MDSNGVSMEDDGQSLSTSKQLTSKQTTSTLSNHNETAVSNRSTGEAPHSYMAARLRQ